VLRKLERIIADRGLCSSGSLSKFCFAISLTVSALISMNPALLGILLVLVYCAILVWNRNFERILKVFLLAMPFALFIFLLHLFTHDGESLFKILFLTATSSGAKAGLMYALKLLVFAFSGFLIFAAVDPYDLIKPVERFSRRLGRVGQSISNMALAFYLALRFLPELSAQAKTTLLALKSRGLDFRGGIIHKGKVMLYVATPLFVNAIKRADIAAMALNVKGYATRYERATFPPPRLQLGSLLILVLSFIIVLVVWGTG
jgi:energy-coupling factor transporter transmembrane protein EcfT